MQDFIVIGLLSFLGIWLSRDVPSDSSLRKFLKALVSLALGFCLVFYYFAYVEEEPEYKFTCSRCGESFVADDPHAPGICAECRSEVMDEQLDQALEEDFPDFEGAYFRTSTCSKCGKKYLENTRITTRSENAPKLCRDCDP